MNDIVFIRRPSDHGINGATSGKNMTATGYRLFLLAKEHILRNVSFILYYLSGFEIAYVDQGQ